MSKQLTNIKKIQELQRKLYNKAKAEPKYRFYSLYDKTYRMDILEEAYRRVKANGGASGIDCVTFREIEKEGQAGYLAILQAELQEGSYKPKPVKRVYIPKANGKMRPLGIPTIRDRIVQTAFLLILEPIFEADFSKSSYGFRPKKSAHDAIREIYKYLNWGCEQIYDVDMEKYFDTVEHYKLLKLVARRTSDAKILKVIKQWLKCGYLEEGQYKKDRKGTPQGGVISPLLANIYLNPVDKAFEREGMSNISKGSIHMIRYADDILILAQSKLKTGITKFQHYVQRLGLKINEEKTRIIDYVKQRRVEFLGFQFLRIENKKNGNRLILIAPSPNSLKRSRERIRAYVNNKLPMKIKEQVKKVNRYLAGWTNYFRLGNSSKALNGINYYVSKRVRKLIQNQRGKYGYGWKNITSDYIYGKLGLYNNYKVQWL